MSPAASSLRYNEVRQKSAHNAFQQQEGIFDQIVYWRIRSLEMDLHRGKAGYIPRHEVLTVFLDIREAFHTTPSASQSGDALDRLLIDSLGEDRLYRPADLLGRAPHGRAAFLSAKVDAAADVPGADPDIVFFNVSDTKVKLAKRVDAAGLVGRAYYINDEERWKAAVEHRCHHVATDDINAREERWSRTASSETGLPFQALDGPTPSLTEAGHLCGVWARSGDIWGEVDSFYYQHADRRDAPDNRYEMFARERGPFG